MSRIFAHLFALARVGNVRTTGGLPKLVAVHTPAALTMVYLRLPYPTAS